MRYFPHKLLTYTRSKPVSFFSSLSRSKKRSVTYTDSDGATVSEMNSRYGDTCHGHGGSDVFPFGLLDTDIDGFEVKRPMYVSTAASPRKFAPGLWSF